MKLARWVLAALIGLWAARGLYFLALTATAKVGALPMTGEAAAMRPFVDAVTPLQLGLSGAAYIGFAVNVWRLLTGRAATALFTLAVAAEAGLYLTLRGMPSYLADASTMRFDQMGLVVLAAGVVLLWWIERSSGRSATAA